MKKKIAIIGSTGSIGKTLLDLIDKNKLKFSIELLSANKNYKTLLKQSKKFNVKKLIITNKKSYNSLKRLTQYLDIKIYNNFDQLDKIFKNKIDYVMSSIIGIEGLEPTIKIIKYTKKIAIANKESIICGWNLINKELKKNKTEFIPVDSEHFSIWYALKNKNIHNVNKIYLTASGGSLLKTPYSQYKNLKLNQILKHPNWRMGKKITIDSSNLMNKVFEIIEAKKIFNLDYNKLSILIHPKSYLHAIIKFNDGMIKLIAHDTTMEIPIFNTLYSENYKGIKTKKLNLQNLNNLNLTKVQKIKFPLINILKKLPKNHSLFETVLVASNDELVNLFLKKKINYSDISKIMIRFISQREFQKYKKIQPKSIKDIIKLNEYVRFKMNSKHI